LHSRAARSSLKRRSPIAKLARESVRIGAPELRQARREKLGIRQLAASTTSTRRSRRTAKKAGSCSMSTLMPTSKARATGTS
jgi:hypothetical protein